MEFLKIGPYVGPYGLIRRYRERAEDFFKAWLANGALPNGLYRRGNTLICDEPVNDLGKISALWTEPRITEIKNHLRDIDAMMKGSGAYCPLMQTQWQYAEPLLRAFAKIDKARTRPKQDMISSLMSDAYDAMKDKRVISDLWEESLKTDNKSKSEHVFRIMIPVQFSEHFSMMRDTLTIRAPMPVSSINGLAGRKLKEILDHPWFNAKDYMIWGAQLDLADNTSVQLHVDYLNDPYLTEVEVIEGVE